MFQPNGGDKLIEGFFTDGILSRGKGSDCGQIAETFCIYLRT
jgi:hypothetical protein